ncbi:TetR family transcriptional regulator, partial [Gordonia aichiensis]
MARDTLTREQIVGAAIELLDEEGLDGLNMRSLGQRLDSAATAMYWHVKNKDNLVRLAVDEVWGEIELPDPDAADWRAAAEAMATGMNATLARHPWLVQAQATSRQLATIVPELLLSGQLIDRSGMAHLISAF